MSATTYSPTHRTGSFPAEVCELVGALALPSRCS